MKSFAGPTAAAVLLVYAPVSFAQVPRDVAAELERIGHVVDVPNTVALYAPMFADQKEPYSGVTVTRDVPYGGNPLQSFDVFTSGRGENKTVVIHVHGGGFSRGDKVLAEGSPFYDNIMLWLVENGMVGVNTNYRLAPAHTWPAAHEDLAAAVRWVKENIAQHGGDPEKIVLWGQSAGAALIAGYLAHPEFHMANGHGISGAVLHSGVYGESPSDYFGRDPQELRHRSSLAGMPKLEIPLMVTYTEVDIPSASPAAEALNQALCNAGKCPTFFEIADHSHISQTFSVGTADTSVSAPVLGFLRGID